MQRTANTGAGITEASIWSAPQRQVRVLNGLSAHLSPTPYSRLSGSPQQYP